jgi:hypothetical protein
MESELFRDLSSNDTVRLTDMDTGAFMDIPEKLVIGEKTYVNVPVYDNLTNAELIDLIDTRILMEVGTLKKEVEVLTHLYGELKEKYATLEPSTFGYKPWIFGIIDERLQQLHVQTFAIIDKNHPNLDTNVLVKFSNDRDVEFTHE